ncbi:hypothetical protein GH733_016666 [Mirounga leonina]|nr:hypothetical protein GH733_016666 [Mirounga leonina]
MDSCSCTMKFQPLAWHLGVYLVGPNHKSLRHWDSPGLRIWSIPRASLHCCSDFILAVFGEYTADGLRPAWLSEGTSPDSSCRCPANYEDKLRAPQIWGSTTPDGHLNQQSKHLIVTAVPQAHLSSRTSRASVPEMR